jgi:hypothetical protein
MQISKSLVFFFLFLSMHMYGQDPSDRSYSFYDYLLEISNTYQIDFAIDPDAGKDIRVNPNKVVKNDRQAQIDELTLLLTDNDLLYLIVDDYTILVRQKIDLPQAETITINGRVKDKDSKEPLAFVSIYVRGASIGTTSDVEGNYLLEIPVEHIGKNLVFQYLGYQNIQVKIPSSNQTINVECAEKPMEINTILISRAPPDIMIDPLGESLSIDLSSYERIGAMAFFDGSRNRIQNLASVNQSQDRHGIYIRGLESNSLLILDDVPIYRYEQFYSFIPLYNSSYFDQLRVYKNTSPIELNHHAFGILDVSSNGGQDNHDLAVEGNLFYGLGEANIEIVPDTWTIKLGVRKSLNGESENPFIRKKDKNPIRESRNNQNDIISSGGIPSVSFENFNISSQIKNDRHYLKWSGQLRKHDQLFASESDIRILNRVIRQEQFQQQASENLGWAIDYGYQWTPAFTSEIKYASAESTYQVDTELTFKDKDTPGGPNTPVNETLDNDFDSKELTLSNTWKGNKEQVRFGLSYQQFNSSLLIKDQDPQSFRLEQEESYVGAFVELENHWTNKWSTVAGLSRYTDQSSNQSYWMNKFLVQYRLGDRTSLRASHSYQQQFYNKGNFENVFGQNFTVYLVPRDIVLPINQVRKWMVGSQFLLDIGKLNIEPFYTKTNGVLNITDIRAGFRNDPERMVDYFIDRGEGRSYGVDLSFDASFKSYRSIIEYTWSKAELNYNRLYQGATLPSFLDRRHQAVWSQQWTQKSFHFNLSNTFKSGTPYLDFANLRDPANRDEIDNVVDLIDRLPFFYSLDMDVSYHFELGNFPTILTFSIINATDRNNVNSVIQSSPLADKMIDLNFLANTQNLNRQISVGFKIRI